MTRAILNRLCVGRKGLSTAFAALVALPLLTAVSSSQAANAAAAVVDNQRPTMRLDAAQLANFDGVYQLEQNALFVVRNIGDSLLGELNLEPELQLYPSDQTTFYAYRETDLCPMEGLVEGRLLAFPRFCVPDRATTVRFVTDASGRARELILNEGGVDRHAPRIDDDTARKAAKVIATHILERRQSPGTEAALRGLLNSIQNGAPDYAALTPAMADVLRGQYSQAAATMKSWGALKRLWWDWHTDAAGADHYLAIFENVQAYCAIMPLTPDGKISDESCRRGPEVAEPGGYQVARRRGRRGGGGGHLTRNCTIWPMEACRVGVWR